MFEPLPGAGKETRERRSQPADQWTVVVPVPADAPAPPVGHPTRGRPSARWSYVSADGALLGEVCRFDLPGGGKEVLPLTFCRHADGRPAWRWKMWTGTRPLYGLDQLAARPAASVVVVEGEKACDAARQLLPDCACITWPGGAKAMAKADWSPLQGRQVILWPDADDPGRDAMAAVSRLARTAGAVDLRTVELPEGLALGWDAADLAAEPDAARRAAGLVGAASATSGAAKPEGAGKPAGGRSGKAAKRGRGPSQSDQLVSFLDDAELWRDEAGEACASVQVAGHVEHWRVRSRGFRSLLVGRFFGEHGNAPGGQGLEDALRALEAMGEHSGVTYQSPLRVGEHDGALYLDLCDPDWRVLEMAATGWAILPRSPVRFRRTPHMRALPPPEPGGMVEELRDYINTADDAGACLVAAWLVAAVRAIGPYPLLHFCGEQGSAKSTATAVCRALIDPNYVPLRAPPRDERDLAVAGANAHCLAFDNVSGISGELSDALCRTATGGGFAIRSLHTDDQESVFGGQRPVVLNGLGDLVLRPDLADRSLVVQLAAINGTRRTERAFWSAFEEARPRILGALADAVCGGLRALPSVKPSTAFRMADFATWSIATEASLGFDAGTFEASYRANRTEADSVAVDADPVAAAIRDWSRRDTFEGWEGTPTELLSLLETMVKEDVRRSRRWPHNAIALGSRLVRFTPPLRAAGVEVLQLRVGHGRTRVVSIRRRPDA